MITRLSVGQADAHMAESILVDLAGMVRVHPWWAVRAELTLDVIEHIDDDRAVVAGLGALVTPGGVLVVSV